MDSIADLITQIKNASAVGKETVTVPHSQMRAAILDVLVREGFIAGVEKRGKKIHKSLEVKLAYDDYGPRVKGVERVSKLSKRLYGGVKDLKPVMQGHGLMLVTTSKGVMTDIEARKNKVGGELLFKIW